MKKLILSIVTLTFLFAYTPAMAARARVPRELCFTASGVGPSILLAFKNGNTIRTLDGPVKMYYIQGQQESPDNYFVPLSGTGYVPPATTVFHGALTGSGNLGATKDSWFLEIFYDLVGETGTVHYNMMGTDDFVRIGASDITTFDCTTAPAAGFIVGGIPESLQRR